MISEPMLRRVSEDVRTALQALMRETEEPRDETEEGKRLRNLAVQGHRLYLTLLPEPARVPDEIRDWLGNDLKEADDEIYFSVPSNLALPWGLIYDKDIRAEKTPEDPASPQHYDAFWATRYRVASLFYRTNPKGIERPRDGKRFMVIAAVNRDTWDRVRAAVADAETQQLFSDFFEKRWVPVSTKDELLKKWRELRDGIDLLYFYGHADGQNLQIDLQELLSHHDVRMYLTRGEATHEKPPSIFLLNGCNTAVSDLDGGFLEACAQQGYCGFIGSEVKIPERLAFQLGLALLDQLVNHKKSLGQAMATVRQRYWPMGLAFSLSCPTGIRVA